MHKLNNQEKWSIRLIAHFHKALRAGGVQFFGTDLFTEFFWQVNSLQKMVITNK